MFSKYPNLTRIVESHVAYCLNQRGSKNDRLIFAVGERNKKKSSFSSPRTGRNNTGNEPPNDVVNGHPFVWLEHGEYEYVVEIDAWWKLCGLGTGEVHRSSRQALPSLSNQKEFAKYEKRRKIWSNLQWYICTVRSSYCGSKSPP